MLKSSIRYSYTHNQIATLSIITEDGLSYIRIRHLAKLVTSLRIKGHTYRVQNIKGLQAFKKSKKRHFKKFENQNFILWSSAIFWIIRLISRFDETDELFILFYWFSQQNNQADVGFVQNQVLEISPYNTNNEFKRANFTISTAVTLKNASTKLLSDHDSYLPWIGIIQLSEHADYLLKNYSKRKLSSHVALRFKALYDKNLILPQKIKSPTNSRIYNHYPNTRGIAHKALVNRLETEFLTKRK